MSEPDEQSRLRREKLAALKAQGRDPFAIARYDRTHTTAELTERFESLQGSVVRVAGRLMAMRPHGKAAFADLQDGYGRVQLFVRVNDVGEEEYARFGDLDLGDLVGAEGELIRTRTGEISVRVAAFTLLSKALRPLPEKWHGLRDVEQRHRQRYLDLMVNPGVRLIFERRVQIVQALRDVLSSRGFLEVETPMMQPLYGGAAARPFVTHHNALEMDLYLRIAPELYLKRLIVGGFERVFEINRNFRNEGISTHHNPEFTMLEAYQAYADFTDMMELCEALVCAAAEKALGKLQIVYQGHEIDLSPPWRRLPMLDAIEEYAGVTLSPDADPRPAAEALHLEIEGEPTFETVLGKAFDRYVEPALIQPTFITDFPTAISPLAKQQADRPEFVDRFEPFIGGLEIGNAFSELNDPIEQRARFEAQAKARAAGDEEAHPMDEDFLRALEYGMPPTGGLGLGVDRLVMLLTDQSSLREVIFFPHLRPQKH
jgi:lysyl-tRNA synthetase class 2